MWHIVHKKIEYYDKLEMLLMFKRLTEISNPSTTSLLKLEVQIKTRGRPKIKNQKPLHQRNGRRVHLNIQTQSMIVAL